MTQEQLVYLTVFGLRAGLAIFDWITFAVILRTIRSLDGDSPAALRERAVIGFAIAVGTTLLAIATLSAGLATSRNPSSLVLNTAAALVITSANLFWLVRYYGDDFDDGDDADPPGPVRAS